MMQGQMPSFWRSALTLVLITFVSFPEGEAAEHDADRIRLDETVISGNQELPKVLYILPWQSPEGRPRLEIAQSLSDDNVLKRVYPPAHRRELQYWNGLKAMDEQSTRMQQPARKGMDEPAN